ncbi:MAG: late competence development ComFB family protein [Provencibacterium sp.]|nr:late competence development ComFB family protein [Provencibacterium sp.]
MAKSKKEIDKDIMYSKIMPTGRSGSRLGPPESEEEPEQADDASPQASPLPAPAPAPAAFTPKSVQLREQSSSVVVNLMEHLVADRLDSAFKKFNCCKCDKCRKDVAAIALNKLQPKYVVTESDKIEEIVKEMAGTEVSTAIVQAVLVVRTHPRH